jgi:hypothetical protein
MLQDQSFRLCEAEQQIGINRGFRCADDARERAGLPDVRMCDPRLVIRVQQRFRRRPGAKVDDPDVQVRKDFSRVGARHTRTGHQRPG